MRIKKDNEWKEAFSMPEYAYEPTVIFSGLTSALSNFLDNNNFSL